MAARKRRPAIPPRCSRPRTVLKNISRHSIRCASTRSASRRSNDCAMSWSPRASSHRAPSRASCAWPPRSFERPSDSTTQPPTRPHTPNVRAIPWSRSTTRKEEQGALRPDEVLDASEIARLLDAAEPGLFRTLFATAAATGMRSEELLALAVGRRRTRRPGGCSCAARCAWTRDAGRDR